jgi:hypothetical protein
MVELGEGTPVVGETSSAGNHSGRIFSKSNGQKGIAHR